MRGLIIILVAFFIVMCSKDKINKTKIEEKPREYIGVMLRGETRRVWGLVESERGKRFLVDTEYLYIKGDKVVFTEPINKARVGKVLRLYNN